MTGVRIDLDHVKTRRHIKRPLLPTVAGDGGSLVAFIDNTNLLLLG